MISPADVVHDAQALIDLWQKEAKKQFLACQDLVKKYGVTDSDYDTDCGHWLFTIDGTRYRWDFGSEHLYLEDDIDEENPVETGKAGEFARAHMAAVHATYSAVEAEMDRRGWDHDPDDYEYHLWKEDWRFDLGYYPTSMNDADNFVYEPDEPGYYYWQPFTEIVSTALWQIRRDNGLLASFTLSELEAQV